MSREETHRRPPARPPGPPRDGPSRAKPPSFTARTDRAAGQVSLRGHLDRVGAEALCRTVTALRQLGHRRVVVRLGSATLTDDARAILAGLARRSPAGEQLVLR